MVFIHFQSHLYVLTVTRGLLCHSHGVKIPSLEFSADSFVCNAEILVGRGKWIEKKKKSSTCKTLKKTNKKNPININGKCERTRRKEKKGKKQYKFKHLENGVNFLNENYGTLKILTYFAFVVFKLKTNKSFLNIFIIDFANFIPQFRTPISQN